MQEERDQEQEERRGPETGREAAKDFIRPYVLDGWTLLELRKKQPHTNRDTYAAQVGKDGGQLQDYHGQAHIVTPQQIAITRIGTAPCWGLFDLAEIMAEIRDEQRGYQQHTLAALFVQAEERERIAQVQRQEEEEQPSNQEPAPPTSKKRGPALYRSYMAGHCENPACGAELGYIETQGGRDRHYCNDACRVAAHRTRQHEKNRAQTLQQHGELREYWKLYGVHGEVLLRLQEILLQYGKAAARAATDAVLVALAANEQAGTSEQNRLIEQIMLGGESIGFEEIKLDNFRIPAGWDGWTEFVSHSSTNYLRQVRGYLYDRKQQEYLKAQGRKRLTALSQAAQEPPKA